MSETDERNAYMREYMRARRAKQKAARDAGAGTTAARMDETPGQDRTSGAGTGARELTNGTGNIARDIMLAIGIILALALLPPLLINHFASRDRPEPDEQDETYNRDAG